MSKSRSKFGAKLGLIYYSRLRVDGISYDTDIGFSGGVLLDFPVSRRFLWGVEADLHDIHIFRTRKKVLDMCLPLKYAIVFERQNWEIRPTVAAGFAYHNEIKSFVEQCTYLTLRGGLEAVFHSDTRYSAVVDFLVFGAPIGGNKDHRVTFGPTFIVRGGVIY
jgi:hypothetical protein